MEKKYDKLMLEDVFVTEGVPEFTFVRPSNYGEILVDVRRAGKPVIVEGQSGTGKTTCIKRILAELSKQLPATYYTARNPEHVAHIRALVSDRRAGTFVIDDFHRLLPADQNALANIAKESAELGSESRLPKLIIIGINEIGSALIQMVPDISKRTGIHRIQPGSEDNIAALIKSGCEKLNIAIRNADAIYLETRGDYWLTQQLCQTICSLSGIIETATELREVTIDMAQTRRQVVERLRHTYYPAVKEFCRGQRFRPSNDPYYRLLRIVGEQGTSIVDLNGLANANSEVRGSINNIKEKRLLALIATKPTVARYFYYNSETKNFAIEDPALFYFIKHLDWAALRMDCGFRDGSRNCDYDVALSFAGENRDLAKSIAESLESLDLTVFFDEFFEANFLGKTWSRQFEEIFGDKSNFVLCILDEYHLKKIWPTFEREIFLPRVQEGNVIPVFLDATKFPGIPQDLVGIKITLDRSDSNGIKEATNQIVLKVIDRIG